MPPVPVLRELTLFVVGGGTDAPGFKIVPDGKGGWKVVPVPGWDPEQMLELASALRVSATAGRLKNGRVSRAILNSAMKVAAEELGGVLGQQKGGAAAVVLVSG
jgi:hypothetical protein